MINSSSPDRSWAVLFEMFPLIKEQVPCAELHLFYGFDNWRVAASQDKLQTDLINRLEHTAKNTPGIVYHERVNQEELADEFMKAQAWVFPTYYPETSCISAMEAQVAGCHVITSNLAALKETVLSGALIDGEWTSMPYGVRFINATVKALNSPFTVPILPASEKFDLFTLANEWETMFYQLMKEKEKTPLFTPYMPTLAYQEKGRGYFDGDPRNNNHNRLEQTNGI